MQVNMLSLFNLASANPNVPDSPDQKEKISQFVDEYFDSLKDEAGIMTEAQRSWALKHINDLDKISQNEKIKELAQILQESPEQLTPTKNTAEVRREINRALLVEGLDRWVKDPNATGNKTEARNRILEAFEKQSSGLVLFHSKLNTLPPEIGLLEQLKTLHLNSNELTDLPAEIGQLAQLRTLMLEHNQFVTLPAGIGKLAQLGYLTLHNNQITTLPAEIGQLAQLKNLDLDHNELAALPPEIGKLVKLESLKLNNNQLTTLPLDIRSLEQLLHLGLDNNQLIALPREIGQLAKLTDLHLRENQLITLPPEIGQLTNLKSLRLESNQLTTLPPTIGNLAQLERLFLNNNPDLTDLPTSLGTLSNLRILSTYDTLIPPEAYLAIKNSRTAKNLSMLTDENSKVFERALLVNGLKRWVADPNANGDKENAGSRILKAFDQRSENLSLSENELDSLPPEIKLLTNLRRIELDGNKFAYLPAEILQLTQLQALSLRRNELKALPPEIGQLSQLENLYLDGNQLTALPAEIGQLSKLKSLNLERNELEALHAEIGQLAKLEWLSLENNRLSALPAQIGGLKQLQELYLAFNKITELPPEIGELKHLELLHLGNNQLTDLPDEIEELAQLGSLYLECNELKDLPAIIRRLAKLQVLRELKLSNNNLTELPPEIGQLAQLRGLYLEDNNLTALPPEIGQLAQLLGVRLGNNNLTALPAEIGQLAQLQELDFNNNPNLAELPFGLGALREITTLSIEGTRILQNVVDTILASARVLRDESALLVLPSRLEVWKAAIGTDAPALAHIEGLEAKEKFSINEWLTRLERCRDFQGNQKEMAHVVLGILESLGDHPAFKEQFFAQVNANLECCEDRAAMSLNEIYTAYLIETTESPALETLIGLAKTLALRKAVMGAVTVTKGQGEIVETYLRYETTLRESLKLVTAIKAGRYTDIGRALDVDALVAVVNRSFREELFGLPIFQTLAMQDPDYKNKYEQINAIFLDRLDELSKEVSSEEYKDQNERIEADRNEKIKTLRIEWLQSKGF